MCDEGVAKSIRCKEEIIMTKKELEILNNGMVHLHQMERHLAVLKETLQDLYLIKED